MCSYSVDWATHAFHPCDRADFAIDDAIRFIIFINSLYLSLFDQAGPIHMLIYLRSGACIKPIVPPRSKHGDASKGDEC
jgi:hypothetical protein